MAKFSRNRNNAKRNSKRRNRSRRGGRTLAWWDKESKPAPKGSLAHDAAEQAERDARGEFGRNEMAALENAGLFGGGKRKQRNTRRNRRGGKRTNKNRKTRNNRNKKTRRQRRR